MAPIKVTLSKDEKTITIVAPIEEKVSASGKSILLVTSRGTLVTDATYKGKEVEANVNITVKNDAYVKPSRSKNQPADADEQEAPATAAKA